MNRRSLALGVFVVLTVAFAAISAIEYSQASSGATTTVTSTLFRTTTTTTGVTVITTTVITGANSVTFTQQGDCSPTVYTAPWSLTIRGNATDGSSISIYRQLPVNGPAPINGGYTASASDANYSMMTFSLPAGTYYYSAVPHGAFYNPTGNFTVSGLNQETTIVLLGPVVSCSTTAKSSISITTTTTIA